MEREGSALWRIEVSEHPQSFLLVSSLLEFFSPFVFLLHFSSSLSLISSHVLTSPLYYLFPLLIKLSLSLSPSSFSAHTPLYSHKTNTTLYGPFTFLFLTHFYPSLLLILFTHSTHTHLPPFTFFLSPFLPPTPSSIHSPFSLPCLSPEYFYPFFPALSPRPLLVLFRFSYSHLHT